MYKINKKLKITGRLSIQTVFYTTDTRIFRIIFIQTQKITIDCSFCFIFFRLFIQIYIKKNNKIKGILTPFTLFFIPVNTQKKTKQNSTFTIITTYYYSKQQETPI